VLQCVVMRCKCVAVVVMKYEFGTMTCVLQVCCRCVAGVLQKVDEVC